MCFICSFIPATIFTVIGFFVLLVANKAGGTMRKFGRILAIWVFFVALMFPVGGAYMTLSGKCPIEKALQIIETCAQQGF